MMIVDRKQTALKNLKEQDMGYMDTSPTERVSFIWELTAELWSLRDRDCAEQRLQRNITNLIGKQG